MAKRSSRSHNTRMSIYAAMGGTNRKEPAGLALPSLPPSRVLTEEDRPSPLRAWCESNVPVAARSH
jgi:hypothetical protein